MCSKLPARMIAQHAHELAAVIVEPLVQGATGMQTAAPSAFRVLGDACHEHDVLLICDEVATGFGRTGTLFASSNNTVLALTVDGSTALGYWLGFFASCKT